MTADVRTMQDTQPWTADLIMCALHMANNPPAGYLAFDLQDVVIARVERVNDVTWAEVST